MNIKKSIKVNGVNAILISELEEILQTNCTISEPKYSLHILAWIRDDT